MKKQLLIISALFISLLSFAQGIVFEQVTWKQVLAKAKQTNKPIFVDVYSSWYEPSKKMNSEVLILEEVGKVYNANFVCYQIDAVKGEGIEFVKKYDVKYYPAFLFIKPDGTLFSKAVGNFLTNDFIKDSKTALDDLKDPKPLVFWDKEYPTMKNDPVFLFNYINKLDKRGESFTELFNEYLNLIPEERRTSDTIVNFYKKERFLNVNSFAYKNLLKNKDKFFEKIHETVYDYLYEGVMTSVDEAIKTKDEQLLNSAMEALDQTPKNKPRISKEEFCMGYYKTTGDSIKYLKYATIYCNGKLMTESPDSISKRDKARFNQIGNLISSGKLVGLGDFTHLAQLKKDAEHVERSIISERLNNIAWEVFLKISDVKGLQDALRWSKRSLEIYPKNPAWMDTYANLLYKLGQKEEAIIIEEEAMNLDNKESKEGFKKTLQKMKAGEKTW
jgi:thiol-disulfide isomerase/thioredoxin